MFAVLGQVGEGWFATLADVPTHAVSLTIPAIMRCDVISCVVPEGLPPPRLPLRRSRLSLDEGERAV